LTDFHRPNQVPGSDSTRNSIDDLWVKLKSEKGEEKG